jgi:poly-gamma-glutamate synthesis protein (capsule biosynthesis protein)
MGLSMAFTGDWILTRSISRSPNTRFRDLIDQFREADVSFAQLETGIHDATGSEVYPAAEAGGTWMAAPDLVAEELAWAGMDMVSLASNHALDYSYGGLRETWSALDRVGIPHAGTGENLSEARSPAYVETAQARVALVSMTSSFTRWARAGRANGNVQGRPGVNPLRFHHAVTDEAAEAIKEVARMLGWWVTETVDRDFRLNPPGLHNTFYHFEAADNGETVTIPNSRDLNANTRAIRDAANQADLVVGHLHSHEFQVEGTVGDVPVFVRETAQACIDAGADLMVVQGTHSPMRGIEIYRGQPIFHDPGDFFRMADSVQQLPPDFYYQFEEALDSHPLDALPSEGFRARRGGSDPDAGSPFEDVTNPPGGYFAGSVRGNILPVCRFTEDGAISSLELYPGTWANDQDSVNIGIPELARGETAKEIIADIQAKSQQYGTRIEMEDGHGVIRNFK